MTNATVAPAGRRVDTIATKQRAADECLDKIGTPTRKVSLGSFPSRYWLAQTSWIVVIIPIRTKENDDGESAGENVRY